MTYYLKLIRRLSHSKYMKTDIHVGMQVIQNNFKRQSQQVQPESVESSTGGVTKVVLIAYHRGGSSFLGELFNQNPDAFYWFEPLNHPINLWAKKQNIKPDQFFIKKNGSVRLLGSHILNVDAFL